MSISTPAPTSWGATGNSTSSSKRAEFAAAVRDRLGRLNGTAAADSEPDSCREVLDTQSGRASRDGRLSGRLGGLLGLTGSRLSLAGRSRVVLAVVLLFIAVTVGAVAWFSWPGPQPATEALAVAQTQGDDAKTTKLKVSVVGDVADPGIVEVAPGSRVADAIEAAGGLAPESATPGYLNLARKVKDGELIVVEAAAEPDEKPETPDDPDQDPTTDTPDEPQPDPNGPVNINEATAEELATLPGIGPVTAASIVDYREQNGGFDSVDQLTEVNGIGPATLDKLADKVTV